MQKPNSPPKPKIQGIIPLAPDMVKPLTLLERPQVMNIRVDLKFKRATAQSMFPDLVFGDDETEAVITEVLRPTKQGEKPVLRHDMSGVSFVIDHYELDGVPV